MELSDPGHGCGAHTSCSPRAKCSQNAQVLYSCPVRSMNTGDHMTAKPFSESKGTFGICHTKKTSNQNFRQDFNFFF